MTRVTGEKLLGLIGHVTSRLFVFSRRFTLFLILQYFSRAWCSAASVMQKTALPLGLLDFTLAHVQLSKSRILSRNLHQAVALAPSHSPHFESEQGKSVFSR